jgi:hypothetical protein
VAARLSLSRADVVTPTGTLNDVTVLVSNNTARLTQRGNGVLLAQLSDVTAVEKTGRSTWNVRAGDGAVWTVTRKGGGCGCH